MAEQPTLGRMGQQFTDPLDSLLRCATMLWNHDSSLRVVWILFFSPYSSGTLFATPFSIVTLLFALFEPCLNAHNRPLRFTRKDTAGELSPSAPSPLRGESWGEAAALWILLANSLRLLPLHAVERAGVRPPPFGYCWRTLSVCSLSTQWRGLG